MRDFFRNEVKQPANRLFYFRYHYDFKKKLILYLEFAIPKLESFVNKISFNTKSRKVKQPARTDEMITFKPQNSITVLLRTVGTFLFISGGNTCHYSPQQPLLLLLLLISDRKSSRCVGETKSMKEYGTIAILNKKSGRTKIAQPNHDHHIVIDITEFNS